jgi:hypothetical protein
MSGEEIKNEVPQQTPPPPPTQHDVHEEQHYGRQRDEKDEKDREKSEKDEKYTRDPLSGIIWALIFIAAGVILLTQSLGFLSWWRFGDGWHIILAIAGLAFILEAAVRLIVPAYRRPILGTLIVGFVLLAIGLGGVTNWDVTWPIILIAIGMAMLLGGLFKGRL